MTCRFASNSILAALVLFGQQYMAALPSQAAQPLQDQPIQASVSAATAEGQSANRATILELVKKLDANEFDERDEATRQLVLIGAEAVDVIVEVIAETGNEAKTRAIHVLRTLALSNDASVELVAAQALNQLIRTDDRSLSMMARGAMEHVADFREESEMQRLERLGAKITWQTRAINGQFVQLPYTITFDDQWSGENTDFRRLRWLRSIREIELEGMKFSDETFSYLPNIPEAHTLNVRKCAITDKAIGFLKDINHLAMIQVVYCPITDDCVKDLAAIEYALEFKLYGTRISREAAESLRDGKLVAEVDYRKGALLGIACPIGSTDCVISTVQPDSAAEKAGIRIGDEILKFNGEAVANIKELTDKISKFAAGDEVSIEWKRDEAILHGKVKLGTW